MASIFVIEQIIFRSENTSGNEDSWLCSLATSHRASLPRNLTMSFIFLKLTAFSFKNEVEDENNVRRKNSYC